MSDSGPIASSGDFSFHQLVLDPRTNRNLFSNYYLDNLLVETEEWDDPDRTGVKAAYDEISQVYDEQRNLVEQYQEAQLEENFIKPIFDILGHEYAVQAKVQRVQRYPDYGFFVDPGAKATAYERVEDENADFYRDAIAVGDAKKWNRPLDSRGNERHDFSNPSHQIHVYLQETPTDWAILTNGKQWRLYYGKTSHRLDSYYEVDLPTLLSVSEDNLEAFKYFYLFFRKEAFLEDTSGETFLDSVFDGSNTFAQALGEDLQDNVYEAIGVIAEGFLQYPENELDPEADLDLIHDSSLIYLYRLIFVLYAESKGRDLLDTDNEIYERNYSLNQLKRDITEELKSADPRYQSWQTQLWDRLDELFTLIDQGSEAFGIPENDLYIPAYNGGLFRTDPDETDSREARFLSENQVGDSYLARVIDLLTRSDDWKGGGKTFVDYSSLDVRHLGSIYEGLLEYELNVADEPLALSDGEYVIADEGNDVVVEESEVYLTTDSGERKATGSYYTPEYVVEYIVENTLGPLVENIRMDLAGQNAFDEGGFAAEFAERIFELKILDPAMGSGHFLTSAIDYLAREIIEAQEKQAAQQGIETVEEDHDINWARRKVAQRCIYGVDLNPLATELAKVSLWLRTIAAEQPLAFLDHHLKTGNSLVGSDIEDVLTNEEDAGAESGQLTLQQSFDHTLKQAIEHVMDHFQDLLSIDNETLADAKEMEDVYEEVSEEPLYQHLLSMANVHTAKEFGLDVPIDADERMVRALQSDSWAKIEGQDWFKSAQMMAEDERFFHWELEFPVAFYNSDGDRKVDAGFDAVIGNPPYVRQEQITGAKPFLKRNFSTYASAADLYVYFIQRGLEVLRDDARFGYITSNKFMRADYGTEVRSYLKQNSVIEEIVDFGELPVFDTASTFPAILILKNSNSGDHQGKVTRVKSLDFDKISEIVAEEHYFTSDQGLNDNGWSLAREEKLNIQAKMETIGTQLSNYLPGEINWGIKTGLNKAFVIDEEQKTSLVQRDPQSEDLIEPLVVGDNVRRYRIENADQYLIVIPSGWTQDQSNLAEEEAAWNWLASEYEAIAEYLSEFEDEARERYDQGEFWWELRPCDYYGVFDEPKLIYPEISMSPRFTIDFEGHYLNNKCFVMPTDDSYLLTLLNSTLLFEIAKLYVSILGDGDAGGRLELRTVHVERLPIADPDPEMDRTIRDSVIEDLLNRYGEWIEGNSEGALTSACKTAKQGIQRRFLSILGDKMLKYHTDRGQYNLNLLDYLGNYEAGPTLPDIGLFQPASSSVLDATAEDYENLRIGNVRTERDDTTVTILATARYKPEDHDAYETDTYGYAETDFFEAFSLADCSETEAALVEAFVPAAVEVASGFAGFRETATKTNSLIDRLKAITLPDPDDVADDLERYVETKKRAAELDERIEKTDKLIDEIVYDLYDLTDEEIEIIESAVQND